jgi:hypothetical protein
VLEDNSRSIDAAVTTYSQSVPTPPRHSPQIPSDPGSQVNPGGGTSGNGTSPNGVIGDGNSGISLRGGNGGCSIVTPGSGSALWFAFAGVGLWLTRRRGAAR